MSPLVRMLRRHEGVRHYAYRDHLGNTTIGVGRCLEPGAGLGLSDDEIDMLLENDIARVTLELQSLFAWFGDLHPPRRDALIDICFNLGLPGLLKFRKAIAAIEAQDWELAAIEFLDSRWRAQVGNRAVELAAMIQTGKYPE